ncbi:ArsA family ATPase [Phycicoccus endophyticus]|uniref:ArsA family ATPase n=1 Tax=Phycicoccus endophyticus TaxID=1690220 RepID=A0A7G9QZW6_9MICO|nr:ArsA family ATPase [Phycicoccus endophyticus]NHI20094.1 ArsA family ATPase [Phycicoccus endophyticus]QNN48891.1 ArsA family ATPase [Phycicoccus endophyticus]GGL45467.1 anion-transporting ATPase [Phycicoccus endophyticus]
MARRGAERLDVDRLLTDPDTGIVVCCGSGGVGKTTTAAALGVRAAEAGRRVVVLTIDPARRLAQSLGLTELDNTPRPVEGVGAAAGGSLDAMMLDMKRTFDEVVLAHSTPEKARQILDNPFYQSVSSSFAGTQEYMAMEKLGQLRAQADRDGTWDLVIVDTPPSRSALDFLDAPKRLGSFLDGRFVRLLMAPAKASGRAYLKVFSVGANLAAATLSKVLGGQFLADVQTFVAALDTMFGGFRQRADVTYALLGEPSTAFVVVAAPERDALREATFFVDRLAAEGMPLAGVVVNRMQVLAAPGLSGSRAAAAAEQLEDRADDADTDAPQPGPTPALLRLHAALAEVAARHEARVRQFAASHPGVPLSMVPAGATDIHDLDGLRSVGASLASGG